MFAVELLRALEAERVIVPRGETWEVGDTSQLRLPFLLRRGIEGRLGRLADIDRERLIAAAVIGQDVPPYCWRVMTTGPSASASATARCSCLSLTG